MDRFGRNYELYVDTASGNTLKINLPFTMEFDIARSILGSANHGSFRIYNLEKNTRNDIRFNNYNYSQFRVVKLYAGYGTNLTLVFAGNVHEAFSHRDGVNYITEIQCFDGGFAYVKSDFSGTVSSGSNRIDVIKQIVDNMKKSDRNISIGSISNSYNSNFNKGFAMSGPSHEKIQEIVSNGFFIDNGQVNCLLNNECRPGTVEVVSAETGLLNVPVLEQSILRFDMIFEPGLIVGQFINVQSESDNTFNGTYKIQSISHRGVISESVCGDAITSVSCLTGAGSLQLVSPQ